MFFEKLTPSTSVSCGQMPILWSMLSTGLNIKGHLTKAVCYYISYRHYEILNCWSVCKLRIKISVLVFYCGNKILVWVWVFMKWSIFLFWAKVFKPNHIKTTSYHACFTYYTVDKKNQVKYSMQKLIVTWQTLFLEMNAKGFYVLL